MNSRSLNCLFFINKSKTLSSDLPTRPRSHWGRFGGLGISRTRAHGSQFSDSLHLELGTKDPGLPWREIWGAEIWGSGKGVLEVPEIGPSWVPGFLRPLRDSEKFGVLNNVALAKIFLCLSKTSQYLSGQLKPSLFKIIRTCYKFLVVLAKISFNLFKIKRYLSGPFQVTSSYT